MLCIEDYPPQNAFYYPLGFYRGIEISIDKNIISKESYEALDIFGVAPSKLIDTKAIANKLGIPVIPFVAADKSYYPKLLETLKKPSALLYGTNARHSPSQLTLHYDSVQMP